VKFALAGSLELFVAVARHLCAAGLRPTVLIVSAEATVDALRAATADLALETLVSADLDADAAPLRQLDLDLLVSVGWPRRLGRAALESARRGGINLHTSRLPAYRGRHPVHWAFIEGETEVGVTVHVMTERFDEGPILVQDAVPIERDDDLQVVLRRLEPVACRALEAGLRGLEAGTIAPRPQPPGGRYWPPRTPEDGRIDWSRPARLVARLVNALVPPLPGAFTRRDDRTVVLRRATCGRRAGEVLARTTDGRYVVGTSDGAALLVESDQDLPIGAVLGDAS